MKLRQEGSVLLLILLTLSALVIVYAKHSFELALARDILYKRRNYEQTFRLNETLLNYALALCTENYTNILKKCEKQKELIGTIDPWPPASIDQNKGIILLRTIGDQILIQSIIENKGKPKGALSCKLTRVVDKDSTRYITSSWQHGSP